MAGSRYLSFENDHGDSFVLADGLTRDGFEQEPYARVEPFWASSIVRGAFLDRRGDVEGLRLFFAEVAGQPADVVASWIDDDGLVDRIVQELERGHVGRLSLYRRAPGGRVWGDAMLPHHPAPPPPPPPVAPSSQPAPTFTCAVVAIGAHCHHSASRKIEGGKTLQVVPEASPGHDLISLSDKIEKAHGGDPKWTLTGGTLEGLAFKATGPATTARWIPSITPRSYTATCQTCSGSSQSLTVEAYPSNQLSAGIDFNALLKTVHKIKEYLEAALEIVVDKLHVEFLNGSGSFMAKWKEADDETAFYFYQIKLELELVKVFVKVKIGPDKPIRIAAKIPGVGRFIKRAADWLAEAGVFVQVEGAISIHAAYERTKKTQPKFTHNLARGLEGRVGVVVGAEAGLVKDDLLHVLLQVSGGFAASGGLEVTEEGLEGKIKLVFEGLKGEGSVKFLWGVINAKHTMILIEEIPIKEWPFKVHPGAEGAGAAEGGAAHE